MYNSLIKYGEISMAKVIILSGAGISAESGISTFRDGDGLWENHKIEDVCMKGCLDTNRDMTIKFYDMLRTNLKDKEPNHAHKIVAKLKNKYPDDIAVITQKFYIKKLVWLLMRLQKILQTI